MNLLVYRFSRPLLGLVWRTLRSVAWVKFRIKYKADYDVSVFRPGSGIHYKWLLTSRRSGEQYLVKTTSPFIEWWHRAVLEWKIQNGYPIDYYSLDFDRIVRDIEYFNSFEELKPISLLEGIASIGSEIWYRYIRDAKSLNVDNPIHNAMWVAAKNLINAHGISHGDDRPDNFLIHNHAIYVIDLESIMRSDCDNSERAHERTIL